MSSDEELVDLTDKAIVKLFYLAMNEVALQQNVTLVYSRYAKDHLIAKRYYLDLLFQKFTQDLKNSSATRYSITVKNIDKFLGSHKAHSNGQALPKADASQVIKFLNQFSEALEYLENENGLTSKRIKIYQIGAYFKDKKWIDSTSVGPALRQPINLKLKKYRDTIVLLLSDETYNNKWGNLRSYISFINIMSKNNY